VGFGAALQRGGGEPFRSFPRGGFGEVLDGGLDLFRSVWDRDSTLGVLDLEYANFKRPGEIFRRPREIFEKMEPVYRVVQKVFYRLNITPLAILTGQGYHFSFRVRQDSPAHRALEALGSLNVSVAAKYRQTGGRSPWPTPRERPSTAWGG
jgi:hypothetical protein